MTPREQERWLATHGKFIRIETMNTGVNIIWSSSRSDGFATGILFNIIEDSREKAMDTLFDQVRGYLYDLVLANGDDTHFPRGVVIR